MVVASNTGVRVLCTVVNGSCCTLESADVSRVLSGAIPANLAIGQRCLRASEAIDPVRSTVIRESLFNYLTLYTHISACQGAIRSQ